MFWTAVWFAVNSLFVISAIFFLFMHRAVAEAVRLGEPPGKVNKLKGWRLSAGIGSVVLFAGMCASFIINMKVNG